MEPTRPANLQFELAFPATTLAAYTKDENGVTRHYLGGTASSTMEDLKGSVISAEAQVMMLEKLRAIARKMSDNKSGMTAWLSHNYTIPEDCLGAFTGASLTTRTEGNDQFIDLDIECRLVDFSSNPRAEAAYKQVQDGIRHGWSIGAYFKEIEWLSDNPDSDDFYKYVVKDIDLLEISLVGIPANQRAWVRDLESAKAYAVTRAERIASDSMSRSHRRELVQRSIVEQRSPAGAQNLALAENFRERAQAPHLDADNVKALQRAAEALESRDDGQSMSPDDMRDRISLAISYQAKAVGHGLCLRSATHIAKSIDCLASVVGANGGAGEPATTVNGGEPDGDEDPQMIMTATAQHNALTELTAAVEAITKQHQEIENMLTSKREILTATEEAVSNMLALDKDATASATATKLEREAELSMLDTDIRVLKEERDFLVTHAREREAQEIVAQTERESVEAAKSAVRAEEVETARQELAAIKAEQAAVLLNIENRKNERLGRMSKTDGLMATIAKSGETFMKPEDYKASHAETQAALVRTATGKKASAPMSGRDAAIDQERLQ